MDISWQIKLLILAILIFLSAFFSGSEVALFSLKREKFKKQNAKRKLIIGYVDNLLDNPKRLLVTILVGNTFVNVAASIIGVAISLELAPLFGVSNEVAITSQIILLTLLILLFGELLPKVYAAKNPDKFVLKTIIPIYWANVLFYPLAETITEFIKLSFSKLKFDKTKTVLKKSEITELTEFSHEKGAIEDEEQELIQGIVSFRSIEAGEIMTPRVDIKAISTEESLHDVISTINETGHSRFPLYKDDLDTIKGIIYAKDILPFVKNPQKGETLSLTSIARQTLFIPKSKKISDLMRQFQKKKMHIAIVVDEYGGTAGLITLEDIVEEVVGDIWDEYDKEEDQIKKISSDKYLVLGKTSVDELNEFFNENVIKQEEGFETVGGFILTSAGSIPEEGYTFRKNNYKFTVREITGKRIRKILIEKEKTE